jgi:hypothetical protein
MSKPIASKIMIIRHAEKPPASPPPYGVTHHGKQDDESLIVLGWQRAGALATYFFPQQQAHFQNPSIATPQTIYASKIETKDAEANDSKGKKKKIGSKSKRPQETVTPLIELLGSKAESNFTFDKGDEAAVAASAMACTGVVLICWEHQSIPAIANGLPVDAQTPVPQQWPVDSKNQGRFDVVWVFDLEKASGPYSFSQVPQCVLAGDSPVIN